MRALVVRRNPCCFSTAVAMHPHPPMETRSAVTSLSIHVAALLLILGLAVATAPVQRPPAVLDLSDKHTLPRYRPLAARPNAGGAAHDRTPPSLGQPPARAIARIFVPPQATVVNTAPKLVMTAAMDVPPSVVSGEIIGDPTGLGHLLSGGIGGHGGIGTGQGPGIGPGAGHAVYSPGKGGVTAPVPIHRVEPEYSDEARKAHVQGAVLVLVDIGPDGRVYNARIARGFGMGLDDKAMQAVVQWRFRPGTKDGHPVTVAAQIEVAFHLL